MEKPEVDPASSVADPGVKPLTPYLFINARLLKIMLFCIQRDMVGMAGRVWNSRFNWQHVQEQLGQPLLDQVDAMNVDEDDLIAIQNKCHGILSIVGD
eukprot:1546067-Karenia_brevis.AAC.1